MAVSLVPNKKCYSWPLILGFVYHVGVFVLYFISLIFFICKRKTTITIITLIVKLYYRFVLDFIMIYNEFIFISLLCILYFYDDERCKMNFPVRNNNVLLYFGA